MAARSTTKKLGPWPAGIDNVSKDTELPTDQNGRAIAVSDSLNGDFSRKGWWETRPGLERLLTQDGLHSAWSSPDGRMYAARGAELLRAVYAGGQLTLKTIATLPSDLPLDFDVYAAETVVSSRDYIGVIDRSDVVRPLCAPDAAMPAVAAVEGTGGLPAARYSVAMSFLTPRGEEGGLSPVTTVQTMADGGGIRITLPSAPGVSMGRLYRTGPNGDMLYHAADVPLMLGTYLLGAGDLGAAAATRNMRAMMPGTMVRYWNGRMLTARGRFLYFSSAGRMLYSPRENFVQFPVPVAFIEGVKGGVFVGLRGDSVLFLRGTRPSEWDYDYGVGEPPIPRSSRLISSSLLNPEYQLKGDVAVWLAENGFVIGSTDGQVIEPQGQRIRLPISASGRTTVFDRRVLTIVKN